MFVRVRLQDLFDSEIFGMRLHVYRTLLPLKRGDLVNAPTRDGVRIAKVYEVNVPESKAFTRYKMKHITEFYKQKG